MSIIANVLLDWKIFVLGFGLLASISVINTKIAILPVSCLTFVLCCVFVWFVSMCVTFVGLHKLLQKNEPLELSLGKSSDKQKELPKQKSELKPNLEKVKKLTSDIDKYFISKWYRNISVDNDFTEESKLFLEEVISRLVEVQFLVNNKILLHGILNIYLKHLKEFRRSLKRKEKYSGSVEEMYRYSHICSSSSSSKPKDYFIHQLTTNLLRHFINSELWNSLPCHVLVSILARKLMSHILNLAANPEILNYIILNSVASPEIRMKYKLDEYSRVRLLQQGDIIAIKKEVVVDSQTKLVEKKPKERDTVDDTNVTECIQKVDKSDEKVSEDVAVLPVTPKKDNLLTVDSRERRKHLKKTVDIAEELVEEIILEKRIASDPVKIYEPKSRNIKTWNDSKDLALGISFGQDPLDAFQNVGETGRTIGRSTFWDAAKIGNSDGSPPTAANILLNEVRHTTQTTMEGLKSSIKPFSDTLHNIKDLQGSTVNNALHRIGDFQDEAAGMVEGILDFGRAGFRKGLRLTGLQDNIETAKATLHLAPTTGGKPQTKKKTTKLVRSESPEKLSLEDSVESVWINPIQLESPNFDGQILLERPKKTEEKEMKPKEDLQIPFISTEQPQISTDSPDPEYEDAADLATSIAKLRSLLQQRSSESSMSTPAISPIFIQAKYYGAKKSGAIDKITFFNTRPPDEFPQRMIEAESVSDVEEGDGVMPSFYKFCAKTATGVFDKTINTLKTALPGNMQGLEQSDNAWIFIQTDQTEADILTRMKKLLTERKEYCTLDTEIDTAYEAIDSLETFHQTGNVGFPANIEFEDELDDFEVKLPVTKALVDIMCELLADTSSPFLQEPLIKAVLLSMGSTIQNVVTWKVDRFMEDLLTNLITIPETMTQKTLSLEMNVYIEAVLKSFPDIVNLTFGKPDLSKALTLFISSLQFKKINEDMLLQIFELISMKLIEERTQISPPASA